MTTDFCKPGYNAVEELQSGGYSISWKMENGHYCVEHKKFYADEVCDFVEDMQRRWERSLPQILRSPLGLKIEFGLAKAKEERTYIEKETLKELVPLLDVVKQYVKLRSQYGRYSGCCPFHKEKTPSFFVWPDKNSWYCFGGCGGGDLFTFLMRVHSVDFKESLEMVRKIYNIF